MTLSLSKEILRDIFIALDKMVTEQKWRQQCNEFDIFVGVAHALWERFYHTPPPPQPQEDLAVSVSDGSEFFAVLLFLFSFFKKPRRERRARDSTHEGEKISVA